MTNEQLNILANRIRKEIKLKTDVKVDVEKVLPQVKAFNKQISKDDEKIKKLEIKIRELRTEKYKLQDSVREIAGGVYYSDPENLIPDITNKILNAKLPSIQEIKEEIILSGNRNLEELVTTLTNKFTS